MQPADLNSNPHSRNIIRYLIDRTIGLRVYPCPGLEHYKLLHLDNFHVSTHVNDTHSKNNKTKIASVV